MAGGRPTLYNENIAKLICERVATHTVGLRRLCEMYDDMPDKTTVNLWRYKHPSFSTLYAQAKIVQADLLAEECLEIADDARGDIKIDENGNEFINSEFVARSRLKIDTRKWLASKLLPKQYGAHADADEKSMLIEKLNQELKELRESLNAKHEQSY